jgi:hypothetical protein
VKKYKIPKNVAGNENLKKKKKSCQKRGRFLKNKKKNCKSKKLKKIKVAKNVAGFKKK